jgi:tol-pal system protein YbgF
MRTSSLVALLAVAFTAAAGPALAQVDPLSDPLPRALGQQADRRLDRLEQTVREMRAILFQGRDTGQPVVIQPAGTQAQVELMSERVGDLEATLRRLNGQIDSLATDISNMRRESARDATETRNQAQVSEQILRRLDGIERQLAARAAADAAAAATERAIAADPVAGFDAAMQLYASGQYRPAAEAFRVWLEANPDNSDAAEANYYLGESYYRLMSYTDAALGYIAAIRGWPQTPWAPDATVKLAVSLIESRRNTEACGVLTEFTTRYPRASAALKAQASQARTRARCG